MSIILGPEWFLGVGSLLEFLTMIMVFCIGYYALRVFHLVSIILLLYIVPYFYARYQQSKNAYTKGIFISFVLILLSHVCFVLLLTGQQGWYVAGVVTQLVGYIFLLAN